jgi:Flp pilus assembly protein TadD
MDDALTSIQKLIKDNPNEGMYKYLQAKMLLEKGDLDSSLKALNALKLDPKYRDEALMDLARVSIQKKDYKTANEVLNQYLTYEPNSDEAKYFSGFVAQQLGQPQVAMQRFREIKQGMYYVNANIQMALLLGANGQVDAGLKMLEPLMTKYPKDAGRIDLVKTQLLLDANRIEEAYGSLNKILKTNESDVELHYIRGLIALELGHPEVAEKDFRFVISVTPQHVEAMNDLTMILIDQKNYDEAKYYIQQVLSFAPNDSKAMGNMGWLLHEQGKTAEAMNYLEKAHAANNRDDSIAAHYGVALWEAGKREAAINVWNKALQASPNDPLLIKVMRDHVVTPASN